MNKIILAWKLYWKIRNFLLLFIAGILLLLSILIYFPYFFNAIEKRNGYVLNDFILNNLLNADLSIPIFSIIWLMIIFSVIRCIQFPATAILFLWSYILLSITRMITISCIALNPPYHYVPLIDPIISIFYGNKLITKDLFYSGHTSTQFLLFLCLPKKTDKLLALIATIVIGFMMLIQHAHYTIDIIAAPLFAWAVYKLAQLITKPTTP